MFNSKFRYTYIQKISNRLVKKILLSLVDKKGILVDSHRLNFDQVTRSYSKSGCSHAIQWHLGPSWAGRRRSKDALPGRFVCMKRVIDSLNLYSLYLPILYHSIGMEKDWGQDRWTEKCRAGQRWQGIIKRAVLLKWIFICRLCVWNVLKCSKWSKDLIHVLTILKSRQTCFFLLLATNCSLSIVQPIIPTIR